MRPCVRRFVSTPSSRRVTRPAYPPSRRRGCSGLPRRRSRSRRRSLELRRPHPRPTWRSPTKIRATIGATIRGRWRGRRAEIPARREGVVDRHRDRDPTTPASTRARAGRAIIVERPRLRPATSRLRSRPALRPRPASRPCTPTDRRAPTQRPVRKPTSSRCRPRLRRAISRVPATVPRPTPSLSPRVGAGR